MKAKDIAIGAGLGLAGVAVLFGTRRAAKRRAAAKKPSVVCPASPVADTSELASGDFVAITLRSADRKLKVATWALVIATGLGAGRDVRVRLVGEFGLAGVRIFAINASSVCPASVPTPRSCSTDSLTRASKYS